MSTKEKLLTSAQKFIAKGQLPRAIKDYQQLVKLDPKDVRNRQKLAELYSRTGMTAEALDAFEGVAKHYSDNGFFLKAIAVYKQMQRLDPARPSISLSLAELNRKQGLIGNALTEYRVLVNSYEKSGEGQKAVEILQKMKDLDPDNLNIRVKIIETHLQRHAPEEAKAAFNEAVEMLEAKHDNPRLLKLYEFFLPHFPEDPAMTIGQARIFIARKEVHRAVPLLTSLLKENPDHFAGLCQFAECCRQKGNFTQEIETYRRLLAIRPEDLQLRLGMLRALLDGAKPDEAAAKLEEWKGAFEKAGQTGAIRDIYSRLKSSLPNEALFSQNIASHGESPGDKGALPEKAPTGSVSVAMPGADEVAAASGPNGSLEEHEDAEEIPLEFLEDFADPPSDCVEPADPDLSELEEEVEADGVELDLDLGFDFDEEPDEEAIFLLDEEETSEGASEADFFDLRSAVLDDVKEEAPSGGTPSSIAPSSKRVKTDVEVEDPDSHYNLGIAYKEMGLLEEAVGEFEKAASEPSLTVPCLTLKGLCLVELGMSQAAEGSFKRALGSPGLDDEARKGLLYELGLLYESLGRLAEAEENFRTVAEIDASFRQVDDKLRQLPAKGSNHHGRQEDKKKDRISYV